MHDARARIRPRPVHPRANRPPRTHRSNPSRAHARPRPAPGLRRPRLHNPLPRPPIFPRPHILFPTSHTRTRTRNHRARVRRTHRAAHNAQRDHRHRPRRGRAGPYRGADRFRVRGRVG